SRTQPPEDDNPWGVPPHPRSVEAQRPQRGTGGGGRSATTKQLGYIRVLIDKQGISYDTLEDTLQARYGHGLNELTAAEASEVIEALQAGQFAAPAERDTADQADEDEEERQRRGEAVRPAVGGADQGVRRAMSAALPWVWRQFCVR